MRPLLTIPLVFCWTTSAPAQSFARDWRPQDRTIIGDYRAVSAVAASTDRVFFVSAGGLLIWNPQFQRWEGAVDPPDPAMLARAFTALTDPLDNSLWLARPDGWIHFQPDIHLWDQGRVLEGIQTIAFDQADPAAGLYLRTRRGWELLPRGGTVPAPANPPARPVAPQTVA